MAAYSEDGKAHQEADISLHNEERKRRLRDRIQYWKDVKAAALPDGKTAAWADKKIRMLEAAIIEIDAQAARGGRGRMNKSQKIIWAQWVSRNQPELAPGTPYCPPGSRWDKLMRLARMGASDRLIKKHIFGIDDETIRVARKIIDGTITGGTNYGRLTEDEPGQEAG